MEQPAEVTAAEKIHVSAQSGTASALFWQGDEESQGLLVIGPVDPAEVVVVGGLEVVATVVVDVTAALVVVDVASPPPPVVVAEATHAQIEPPAPRALRRSSVSVQWASTQLKALAEIASDEAGVHWPRLKSV